MPRGDTDWLRLVKECQEADKISDNSDRRWALGDVARKVSTAEVKTLAVDVGISPQTLYNCRHTAIAWPPDTREVPGVSWTVYQDLVNKKYLMRPNLVSDEARRLVRLENEKHANSEVTSDEEEFEGMYVGAKDLAFNQHYRSMKQLLGFIVRYQWSDDAKRKVADLLEEALKELENEQTPRSGHGYPHAQGIL